MGVAPSPPQTRSARWGAPDPDPGISRRAGHGPGQAFIHIHLTRALGTCSVHTPHTPEEWGLAALTRTSALRELTSEEVITRKGSESEHQEGRRRAETRGWPPARKGTWKEVKEVGNAHQQGRSRSPGPARRCTGAQRSSEARPG